MSGYCNNSKEAKLVSINRIVPEQKCLTSTVFHTKTLENTFFSKLFDPMHICIQHHEVPSFVSLLHHMASHHVIVT